MSYFDCVACQVFELPPPIAMLQLSVPWPKFAPARADAFITPVHVAVLLLIGQGVVNVMLPRLVTDPEARREALLPLHERGLLMIISEALV